VFLPLTFGDMPEDERMRVRQQIEQHDEQDAEGNTLDRWTPWTARAIFSEIH
jgi:hypothetical protein